MNILKSAAAFLAVCAMAIGACGGDAYGPRVKIDDREFPAEIAATRKAQSRGLGERDHLAFGSGMLFVYGDEPAPAFWMRGMRFALDFVWIGSDCEVVDVTERAPPPAGEDESALPIYESDVPAAHVFEMNAGDVQRYRIKVGDKVEFLNISATDDCAPEPE